MLVPLGMLLGHPDARPGFGCCSARAPQMVPWAWGMNGALSVLGATLAIFIAMNWGFQVTLWPRRSPTFSALAALARGR